MQDNKLCGCFRMASKITGPSNFLFWGYAKINFGVYVNHNHIITTNILFFMKMRLLISHPIRISRQLHTNQPLLDMSFSFVVYFLQLSTLDTNFSSILKFSGVMLSIRSSIVISECKVKLRLFPH